MGKGVTAYEYYPDGRLSKITRPNGTTRLQQYALDGRLSRVEERTSSGRVIALYQYNYNANGTLESRFSLPQPQPYKLPDKTMTFDSDNRMITCDGMTAAYDDDGNLLSGIPITDSKKPVTNCVYNSRNLLIRADSTNSWIEYAYDAAGNRIRSIAHDSSLTVTNTYVINPNASLSQMLVREKNGIHTWYVYGLGLLYEVAESGNTRAYHHDLTGSTVALTDDSGTITDRIEYSPYGTVTHREGTTDTPFLYVGQYGVQTDPNGLLYMRARYYSPQLRRFLNSDPIGLSGGYNLFAYAGGDPISRSDPSGLQDYAMVWGEAVNYGRQVSTWDGPYGVADTAALVGLGAVGIGLGVAWVWNEAPSLYDLVVSMAGPWQYPPMKDQDRVIIKLEETFQKNSVGDGKFNFNMGGKPPWNMPQWLAKVIGAAGLSGWATYEYLKWREDAYPAENQQDWPSTWRNVGQSTQAEALDTTKSNQTTDSLATESTSPTGGAGSSGLKCP